MPLELRQVTSPSEVPEIVQGWLENEFILTPTLVAVNWGTDEESYKDRIKDLSARHWFMHSATPGSVWLKVIDTDHDKEVVAASRWTVPTETASTGIEILSECTGCLAVWNGGSGSGRTLLRCTTIQPDKSRLFVSRFAQVDSVEANSAVYRTEY